jgi:hypothetical protein
MHADLKRLATAVFGVCLTTACGGGEDALTPIADAKATAGAEADCEPELLSDDGGLPAWMAVSGDYVYWIDGADNSLRRQSKEGTEPARAAQDVANLWAGIAADTEAVYVAGKDGMIHQLSVDRPADVALANVGGERATQLHVSGSDVYWLATSGEPLNGGRVSAEVRRVRTHASEPAETLWSSDKSSYGLALAGEYIFVDEYTWPGIGGEPQANGTILRVASAQGSTVPLVSDLLFPFVHAADEHFVYYSAQTHDTDRITQLWRIDVEGGTPELVYQGGPANEVDVGQMIVDDEFAWWGQANEGRVVRVPVVGGEPATAAMVSDSQHTLGLAADDFRLYFSGSYSQDVAGPGTIWSVGRDCPFHQ